MATIEQGGDSRGGNGDRAHRFVRLGGRVSTAGRKPSLAAARKGDEKLGGGWSGRRIWKCTLRARRVRIGDGVGEMEVPGSNWNWNCSLLLPSLRLDEPLWVKDRTAQGRA